MNCLVSANGLFFSEDEILFYLLACTLCRASIKRNDLANLRLPQVEIDALQLYQQGKLFELEHAVHFSQQKSTNQVEIASNTSDYIRISLFFHLGRK